MISQSLVRDLFLLDEKTGILRWRYFRAPRALEGQIAGCFNRSVGRWVIKFNDHHFLRSRLVFLYVHGWLPAIVDHADRNGLNDCPGNLRVATKSQNCVKEEAHAVYQVAAIRVHGEFACVE
jgi:hypothetical protein